MPKMCERCGKILTGECWYRRDYDSDPPRIEYYCTHCAACMVDEHTTNGLIITWADVKLEGGYDIYDRRRA